MSFDESVASIVSPKKEGWAENKSASPSSFPLSAKEGKQSVYSDEEIEKWILSDNNLEEHMCCLLYGKDGTGKSGLVLSYLTDEDIKAGKKAVVIDLDGGNLPLLKRYHSNKIKNFIIKNPLVEGYNDNEVYIDYKKTFSRMRAMVKWTRANWEKHNIKFIVFDGLSKALKHAEYQMRLEKHLMPDGGVQTRFWLVRNRLFLETLQLIKSLPISTFFIAHEDFVLKKDEKNSSVKEETNSIMHHKILCERQVKPGKVTFTAQIDKSKYNVKVEGRRTAFCEVDLDTGKYEWKAKEVFEGLL